MGLPLCCSRCRSYRPPVVLRFSRTAEKAVYLFVHLHYYLCCPPGSHQGLLDTKGAPSLILSDNHQDFVSGEKFLLELQDDPQIHEYLTSHRIEWKHQTPRSPWMGGHFESLVRTIKSSLSTAIARKLYNYVEFVTVAKEVEKNVNSHPLTYQGTDTMDIPLRPSQLVWGRDLALMPPLLPPVGVTMTIMKQER